MDDNDRAVARVLLQKIAEIEEGISVLRLIVETVIATGDPPPVVTREISRWEKPRLSARKIHDNAITTLREINAPARAGDIADLLEEKFPGFCVEPAKVGLQLKKLIQSGAVLASGVRAGTYYRLAEWSMSEMVVGWPAPEDAEAGAAHR